MPLHALRKATNGKLSSIFHNTPESDCVMCLKINQRPSYPRSWFLSLFFGNLPTQALNWGTADWLSSPTWSPCSCVSFEDTKLLWWLRSHDTPGTLSMLVCLPYSCTFGEEHWPKVISQAHWPFLLVTLPTLQLLPLRKVLTVATAVHPVGSAARGLYWHSQFGWMAPGHKLWISTFWCPAVLPLTSLGRRMTCLCVFALVFSFTPTV